MTRLQIIQQVLREHGAGYGWAMRASGSPGGWTCRCGAKGAITTTRVTIRAHHEAHLAEVLDAALTAAEVSA